ncbi:PAS domain S-box protein [Pseudodesulfovibrio cashew]|uniref:PAS domain S-box protein n=1 Tax=Pseudodesulfovibrio cashew TaxID=2678688 RepID=A0A6I6JHG6_9BACT|nr:PAS domain S-box protein [Pseudodesulfovibrio cashew]QGY39802.1 PAS domain S-box protein [Pseudodesulfovibrio cashew]
MVYEKKLADRIRLQAERLGLSLHGEGGDAPWLTLAGIVAEEMRKQLSPEMPIASDSFPAVLDSLTLAVFLLGPDATIVTRNQAAAALCADDGGSSLARAIPWLHEALEASSRENGGYRECRFDLPTIIGDTERFFSITVSSHPAFFTDDVLTLVVVDDVTSTVERERQLMKDHNQATNYLDVVGSIVLAMDVSCSVLLLNQTGCDTLGYESWEIIGQSWIDLVVPPEERDQIKDYFYSIMADNMDTDDIRTNTVITKDGRRLLIEWNNRILRNEGGLPVGILASGADVTERRKIEHALAEKEIWLRSSFVALNEAVLILTPERKIMDANPAAEAMFQLSNEELRHTSVEDLHVNQEASERYHKLTVDAFERNEKAEFEFDLRRHNGEIFPAENSLSLIINDYGEPLGVVNVIRDISSRKEQETILRKSEEKFRRIFESMREGFVVTDMDGVIQMINPATSVLLGYSSEEMIGESVAMLYSNPDERRDLRHQLATRGAVTGMQLSATTKDGTPITVEANAHVVRDDDGNPIAMEGTFRDITARLEADKVLREREKQYRAFFENNHAIMLLENPRTGRIVDANPAASEFYGYTVEEMRAMRMEQISALSPEEIYQEMFSARKENRVYFIFKHILANGEIRDVEVYSGPIMVQGNQLLYSVIHDVTERIRLQREMKRMATTDSLTGASNRHQFFQLGEKELERALRYGRPLTVLMLDIDYFKSINDTYGHKVGDDVLRALAAATKETLRQSDIFGRLGGEEFAAVLPETSKETGTEVAERLRDRLASIRVQAKEETVSFTVSIGISTADEGDMSIGTVLNRADEALYRAKRGGRNRIAGN